MRGYYTYTVTSPRWQNFQCNEYEFLQSLTSFCYNYISKKHSSEVRDVKELEQRFSVTWEVGRWERIFYFIDIRLKLINFELKKKNITNITTYASVFRVRV